MHEESELEEGFETEIALDAQEEPIDKVERGLSCHEQTKAFSHRDRQAQAYCESTKLQTKERAPNKGQQDLSIEKEERGQVLTKADPQAQSDGGPNNDVNIDFERQANKEGGSIEEVVGVFRNQIQGEGSLSNGCGEKLTTSRRHLIDLRTYREAKTNVPSTLVTLNVGTDLFFAF